MQTKPGLKRVGVTHAHTPTHARAGSSTKTKNDNSVVDHLVSKMSKFDDLLKQLGTGVWNVFVVVAMCYWIPQIASQSMGAAFMTPELDHSCRPPPDAFQDARGATSFQCEYNATVSEGSVEERACTRWNYDNSTFVNTLTSEFDLVCGRSYLRAAYKSVYFLGGMFGAMLNGWLSDRFGRKTMLVVGSVMYSVLANILSWLPNFSVILALRFWMGLMHPTSIHAGYTLAMEVNQPKHRAASGILIFLPWAFVNIALAGYGYLLRDWRWLSFTISVPALLFLPALWFIDESPRWLIVRGRYDDAMLVLRRAARLNKVELPPEEELRTLMEHIKKEALVEGRAGKASTPGFINALKVIAKEVTVLVKTRRMRSITLSFYAQFVVLGMVYYGISFGADKLDVDPFVYMAVNGVVEIPSGTITIPLVDRLGRRLSCTLSFVITAGSLMVLGFIPSGLNWLVIMMALVGKLGISIAYQVVFLYACELFPTEVRVRGLGTSTILAKAGAMVAPFILEILGNVKAWLPLVLFGVAAFLAGVVTFWLPESLTAPMLDTVAELEAAYGARDARDATDEHQMEQPNETTREQA